MSYNNNINLDFYRLSKWILIENRNGFLSNKKHEVLKNVSCLNDDLYVDQKKL